LGENAADDLALAKIVMAWPALPAAVRAGIVAMVQASKGADDGRGGTP